MADLNNSLPGIYTEEVEGPRLNTTVGGNAVVAFVGPAIGFRTATQQITLEGATAVPLNNAGVIADSYTVISASSGVQFVNEQDYTVVQGADQKATIARKLLRSTTTKNTVTEKQYTYFSAQPSFSILFDGENNPIAGFVIAGTVVVKDDKSKNYVEGTDYIINYQTGTFSSKIGGALANNTKLSISFDWATAEPVQLNGEAAYTLSHPYVSKDESGESTVVIVSSATDGNAYGDTPDGNGSGQVEGGYVEGIDFVVDYQTGRISRTPSSRIPTFDESKGNYMYAAYAYCGIRSGDRVVVSYNYKGDAYTAPQYFASYNECIDVYGVPWDAAGNVQSPLSLAIYIASLCGLSGFYAAACNPATQGGSAATYTVQSFEDAFEQLTKVSGIDIVVPVSGSPEVWNAAQAHIRIMKENADERIAFMGADGTEEAVTSDQMIAYAKSIASEDCVLVSPATFQFRNRQTNVVEAIAGFYGAAAVAGLASSMAQYNPLTHKKVLGLYGPNETFTTTVKTNQVNNGLLFIDYINAAMTVIQGITTSTASVVKRELNIQMCKLYIVKSLRRAFASGFIGSVATAQVLLDIKSSTAALLSRMQTDGYLTEYTDPLVEQDATDPTQVNISLGYTPTYGINRIYIKFSINGTTAV